MSTTKPTNQQTNNMKTNKQNVADAMQSVKEVVTGVNHTHPDQYRKGFPYVDAETLGEDHRQAVKWYRKAAEQGNAAAQYRLGFAYQYGSGVEKDLAEAVKWYRKAADQGDTLSEAALGFAYLRGEGVAKDPVEGWKQIDKAAIKGYGRGNLRFFAHKAMTES